MSKKLKATFNAVIVEPQQHGETKKGNIIVPDLGKEKNLVGTIVSVGAGHYSVTGEFIKTILEEGQTVILPQLGVTKIEFEGKEYWACPENTVLGIIE